MAQAQQTRRITAQEYVKLYPETTQPMELIDGEVIVSPAPFDIHQYIVGQLYWRLMNVVAPNKLGEVRISPSDVHLDMNNVVQPDIFFVSKDNDRCKLGDDQYWHGAPDLCIEVISRGTARRDRITKFNLYAQHGVREYWIVEPEARFIEVFVLEDDTFKRHAAYADGDTLTSPVIPQLNLNVSDVFPPQESDETSG